MELLQLRREVQELIEGKAAEPKKGITGERRAVRPT
jgi:hypothetical protein